MDNTNQQITGNSIPMTIYHDGFNYAVTTNANPDSLHLGLDSMFETFLRDQEQRASYQTIYFKYQFMNTKTTLILMFSLVAIVGISIYAFSHSPEVTCYGRILARHVQLVSLALIVLSKAAGVAFADSITNDEYKKM